MLSGVRDLELSFYFLIEDVGSHSRVCLHVCNFLASGFIHNLQKLFFRFTVFPSDALSLGFRAFGSQVFVENVCVMVVWSRFRKFRT